MQTNKQYACEHFLAAAKISGLAFSPDEDRILFSSDASGILNAYEISISDRRQIQLTRSTTENIQSVSYFPKDERILVSRDCGGVENAVLCVCDRDGNERRLVYGERVQAHFHGWSADRESFYVSTNERNGRLFDLYKIDAASYQRRLLFESPDKYHFSGISPDEHFALFVKAPSISSANIFLCDLSTQEMKSLTNDESDVLNCLPVFDREAAAIYYISDKGSDYRYLIRHDLLTNESTCVERSTSDIAWTFFSADFRRRITLLNETGSTQRIMKIHDQETGAVFTMPGFSQASITAAAISDSGRFLAFYVNGDRSPGNIHLYDFETGQTAQLTETLSPELDRNDLVESEVIRFHSFDGMEIPCLLWRPHMATITSKAPALIWVHGGPGGRMSKGYKGRIQYLVNHGYVVLGVNHRGSSGFGKEFLSADRLKHGREPLWDCVMAKRYLAALDYVDSSNIGIVGASFGGYMVLAALAFQPEEFSAGVDICGPSNFLTLAGSLPAHWDEKRFYEKLGDLETDLEGLRSISPFFSADRIKKPLMILQGACDPRCPREQSDEMVKAIRETGGKVEYLVFEDEAHGFRKTKNAIYAFESILKFLDANLRNKNSA